MLTPKQNVMEVFKWGKPEYIPYTNEAIQLVGVLPSAVFETPAEGEDGFGVPWVAEKAGPMVPGGYSQFDDITEWEKYIHFPDLDSIDWHAMAAQELDNFDSSQKMTTLFFAGGIFIRLANLMGFENCLISTALEPEATMACFDALSDYAVEYINRAVDAYHPDMVTVFDDICTASGPFLSLDTYRKVLKPYQKKIIQCIRNHGLIAQEHTCGNVMKLLDDYVDMGIQSWHGAQAMNDIAGVLDRYRGKMVIEGGWDSQGTVGYMDATADMMRDETRRCMTEYGSHPGYIFSPLIMNERGCSFFVGDDRIYAVEEEWERLRWLH